MRRIVISVQNALLASFLEKSLMERGDMLPETVSGVPEEGDIVSLCFNLKPDVLLLEFTPYSPFDYATRMKVIEQVRQVAPRCRIAALSDDNTWRDLSEQLQEAKKAGIVDNFFYTSVSGSYLAAALEAM